MSVRSKFATRTIYIAGETQRDTLIQCARNLPLDKDNPLEVVIREKQKVRGLDANALMWVGPLKNIAEQAWVNGRTFSDVVWHEHFKALYLPEEYDPELTKEGYKKWDYTPSGDKVLVGSTTELLKKGFSIYLEQIHADGANMGVQFSASPNSAITR